jgi:phosphatidylserine/phosphatidylglycerophosphate/cardiolipin synthase-like enzyme
MLPDLNSERMILILVSLLLVSLACGTTAAPETGVPDTGGSEPAASPVTDWGRVYFTDPNSPNAQSLRGGPDRELANAIRAARVSVDAAIYELDLWSIRDALLDAHRRGLNVRVVAETDYLENPEMQDLISAGIEVRDDRKDSLMHNKFIVIDRQEVWTGSMNYTVNDGYKNNNNLLCLRSSQLAADYTAEFEEMFIDNRFGAGSPANTAYPSITLDGTRSEVFFSPDDGVQARLVELLSAAQESIDFMAFSFTSDELANAILERAKAGVTVQGVMEARQYETNVGTEYDNFISAGLDVRLDGNPYSMHHKVMIIDRQIVITGSYNFTFSAETRNDENLLVFYNLSMASLFMQEFQRVFADAAR